MFKRIGIFGPLFTKYERKENLEIARTLEKSGFSTFLPQRDVGMYEEIVARVVDRGFSRERAIQAARMFVSLGDSYETSKCDAFVLNYNGRVPDEGAVFEAGTVYGLRKLLVIYKNDARSLIDGLDNPAVIISTGVIVSRMKDIPKELRRLEQLKKSQYQEVFRLAEKVFRDLNLNNSGDLGLAIDRIID